MNQPLSVQHSSHHLAVLELNPSGSQPGFWKSFSFSVLASFERGFQVRCQTRPHQVIPMLRSGEVLGSFYSPNSNTVFCFFPVPTYLRAGMEIYIASTHGYFSFQACAKLSSPAAVRVDRTGEKVWKCQETILVRLVFKFPKAPFNLDSFYRERSCNCIYHQQHS